MKSHYPILIGFLSLSATLLAGCDSTDYSTTSPYHPGPVMGQAVGTAAGVVAGNAAGIGVGVVQGATAGAMAPFNPDYHMVRTWRTETTADGRTIQVPYDLLVDRYGRPVNGMPAPTGNPPPPAAPTNPPPQ